MKLTVWACSLDGVDKKLQRAFGLKSFWKEADWWIKEKTGRQY
jgi:hypothetical protein